jgi:hypothetical protein
VTQGEVFLDIDGVLAPMRQWDRYGELDPLCIQVLNEIAHQTLRVTPAMEAGITDHVWSAEEIARPSD